MTCCISCLYNNIAALTCKLKLNNTARLFWTYLRVHSVCQLMLNDLLSTYSNKLQMCGNKVEGLTERSLKGAMFDSGLVTHSTNTITVASLIYLLPKCA